MHGICGTRISKRAGLRWLAPENLSEPPYNSLKGLRSCRNISLKGGSCRTPVIAKPMMMRAHTSIKTEVNRRERLGSLIRGQSLAGAVRGGYRAPALRQPTAYNCASPHYPKADRH